MGLIWDAPTIPLLHDTSVTLMGSWQERNQDSLADIDSEFPIAAG